MISPSTIMHLRFPFSFFLLPVYLMALVFSPGYDTGRALIIFTALHLMLYPGSSGFNAWFDRDTGSIGMLKKPPRVTPDLLPVSLTLKAAAVLTALFAGAGISCGCLLYAVASILYSADSVRLKGRAWLGWLLTGIGQGFIMFLAVRISLSETGSSVPSSPVLVAALCMACMILAASPLLEIFQHDEDAARGDMTVSRLLGIRGTLALSGTLFAASTAGFSVVIFRTFTAATTVLFLVSLAPGTALFIGLCIKLRMKGESPGYGDVMPVALTASGGLNGFGLIVLAGRLFA